MRPAVVEHDFVEPTFQAGVAPVFADKFVNAKKHFLGDIIYLVDVAEVLVYQVEHVPLVARDKFVKCEAVAGLAPGDQVANLWRVVLKVCVRHILNCVHPAFD